MRRAALMRLANQIVVAHTLLKLSIGLAQETQFRYMYFGNDVDVCMFNLLHVLRTKLCRANRKQEEL